MLTLTPTLTPLLVICRRADLRAPPAESLAGRLTLASMWASALASGSARARLDRSALSDAAAVAEARFRERAARLWIPLEVEGLWAARRERRRGRALAVRLRRFVAFCEEEVVVVVVERCAVTGRGCGRLGA